MVRRPRIDYQGGVFHVIQRGNNREFIFKDDMDKGYLMNQLKKLKQGMGYNLYGFVLMDNHYHFILRTFQEPLSTIMHRINYKYSRYFNQRYERKGHVFGGRYKAILVEDEKYLLALLRYIHKNPVRAGLCQRVEEHHWSSDYYYRTTNNELVDIHFILDLFSPNTKEATALYRQFMSADETDDYEQTKKLKPHQELPYNPSSVSQKVTLDDILRQSVTCAEDFELIKKGCRDRKLTPYKLSYIKIALEMQYTLAAIGTNINISSAAIHDLLRRNNLIT